jgi:cytochrome c-type biogenesis protein CcmH
VTGFVAVSGLLVVVGLALLAFGLLRRRQAQGQGQALDRNAENVVIARERLRELRADLNEGRVSEAEFAARREELESALIDDIADDGAEAVQERSVWYGRWTVAALLVVLPWVTVGVYLAVGTPSALTGTPQVRASTNPHGTGMASGEDAPSVQELVGRLEERLRQEPDNAEGWTLLARTYMSMERYPDAVKAFERVQTLVGDQSEVLLGLADAIAMTQGGRLTGRPATLIDKALELNPNAPIGLWLGGMAAEEQGNFERALTLWQRLEPLVADDPQSSQQVRAMIARVAQKAGVEVPAQVAAAAPPTDSTDTGQGGGGAALTVDVSLDPALKARVSPDDTVFVYAKATEGPPMPLAIARHRVADLPLRVKLDDSMAMMPAMRLSQFPQVEVIARVSKAGSAMPQTGDLVGSRSPVSPASTEQVAIVINDVIP